MADMNRPTAMPVLLQNPVAPRRLGRAGAVLAVACLVAHLPLIASHFDAAPALSTVMALVSLACVPCARRLWMTPTAQDCTIAAVLAATMIGLHMFLGVSMAGPTVAPPTDIPTPMHHHGGGSTMSDPAQSSMPVAEMHHMAMSPAIEVIFDLATAMAMLQMLVNVLAIAVTIRRVKGKRTPVGPVMDLGRRFVVTAQQMPSNGIAHQ